MRLYIDEPQIIYVHAMSSVRWILAECKARNLHGVVRIPKDKTYGFCIEIDCLPEVLKDIRTQFNTRPYEPKLNRKTT